MYKRLLQGLAIFGMAALAPPVSAQATVCAPRDVIVERLGATFSETLTGVGLRSDQVALELWSAPETGTWTVLLTHVNGTSCIMASGSDWHLSIPQTGGTGIAG